MVVPHAAGDEAAFKSNLLRVLRDAALRGRLGDNAPEDVRRFDAARHAQELVSLCTQLLPREPARGTAL